MSTCLREVRKGDYKRDFESLIAVACWLLISNFETCRMQSPRRRKELNSIHVDPFHQPTENHPWSHWSQWGRNLLLNRQFGVHLKWDQPQSKLSGIFHSLLVTVRHRLQRRTQSHFIKTMGFSLAFSHIHVFIFPNSNWIFLATKCLMIET